MLIGKKGIKMAIQDSINWDDIMKKLEKWRRNVLNTPGSENPAVTTIAEEYGKGTGTAEEAWAVLVSTILSLRTKDDVTRITSRKLLNRAPNPETLAKLSVKEVAALAYPAGFYRNKAESLKKIADILLEKYDGLVPNNMDELLALPGVGRKTANLVLIEAFNMYGICVDIHVHRISNRAGWVDTPNPDKTEMVLREIQPKKYWKKINAYLVLYGQHVCRPLSPYCSKCVITEHCKKNNVEKSR